MEHEGDIVLTKGKLRAMDCLTCGFAHLWPLPRRDKLDAYWSDLYAGRFLYEQEAGQGWYWRHVYLERMRRFDGLRLSISQTFSAWFFLDYGAGVGNFIASVSGRFNWWKKWGYEPNAVARSKSRFPYQYVSGPQSGYYDAVHCSLVLEHVPDAGATLKNVHGLLVPGGVLCLVVPNEFNPLQRKLYRWGYSPLCPHHVNYFTPKTLTALVERTGFEIIEVTATFPIEALALAGLNYVRHPRLGVVAHWLRMAFEVALLAVAPGAKRKLYKWFAEKGIGREIELWARKAY